MNGSGLDWTGTELLNCFESTLTFPNIQRMSDESGDGGSERHIPERFSFCWGGARGKFCDVHNEEVKLIEWKSCHLRHVRSS